MEAALLASPLKDKQDNIEAWDDFLYNIRLRYI
jgi:hypothetical protein